MSAKKGGLGKGVNALFRDKETNTTLHGAVTELPLASVVPNSQQARRIFDEQALQELSESIRTYGIVQPLVVRAVGEGRYEIIAGERRWRAAKAAGLTQVPVVVRTYEDRVAAEVSLIENIQRENLNVVEEATAYKVLIDMNGWTQEELAEKVGKSRSHVANLMRLLGLSPAVLKAVEAGVLTMGQARPLLALSEESVQKKAALHIATAGLNARQAELFVKHLLEGSQGRSDVPPADAHVEALRDRLKMHFGTNVVIRINKKNKGKIEISFASEAEFERLMSLLTETNTQETMRDGLSFTV